MTEIKSPSELYNVILKLKTVDDCEKMFNDLFTPAELQSLEQRILSAKLLLQGETYEQIINKTAISSATLSRVNKCVKYGEGYKKFLSEETKNN